MAKCERCGFVVTSEYLAAHEWLCAKHDPAGGSRGNAWSNLVDRMAHAAALCDTSHKDAYNALEDGRRTIMVLQDEIDALHDELNEQGAELARALGK